MRSAYADLMALYLPQFHPIPENDEWWGRGFAEWAKVAKANPRFPAIGSRMCQPISASTICLPEVHEGQAELARNAGVGAFYYWHHWLGNGRRIIERPFEEVLSRRERSHAVRLSGSPVDLEIEDVVHKVT